jgi:hypothetical protein
MRSTARTSALGHTFSEPCSGSAPNLVRGKYRSLVPWYHITGGYFFETTSLESENGFFTSLVPFSNIYITGSSSITLLGGRNLFSLHHWFLNDFGHITGTFSHITGTFSHITGTSSHITGVIGHITGTSRHITSAVMWLARSFHLFRAPSRGGK